MDDGAWGSDGGGRAGQKEGRNEWWQQQQRFVRVHQCGVSLRVIFSPTLLQQCKVIYYGAWSSLSAGLQGMQNVKRVKMGNHSPRVMCLHRARSYSPCHA